MSNTKYTRKEIAERGEAIYEEEIRANVDPAHHGAYLVLDIETGDYEVDSDDLTATQRIMSRLPDAVLYGLRIGYPAAYKLGGLSKVPVE